MSAPGIQENTYRVEKLPDSLRALKNKRGSLAKLALEQRAQELLRRINGTLSKIETRMAQLSSPAELKKLEQDQVSLRLRASRILQALEDGSPDAFHHLHDDHHDHGHDGGHCHHVTAEMQALHAVAGDEKQALYRYDQHDSSRTGFTAHDGAERIAVFNAQVMLGGVMDAAQALASHILPGNAMAL